MKALKLAKPVLICATLFCPAAAMACGELKFAAGKGLPFQRYLTPRPATVLMLSSATTESGDVFAGLEKAGHRITMVPNVAALQEALGKQRYDVVITGLDSADAVTSSVASGDTRLLPVIARSLRNSAQVRGFEQFVLDGASLGQYLTVINRLLPKVR